MCELIVFNFDRNLYIKNCEKLVKFQKIIEKRINLLKLSAFTIFKIKISNLRKKFNKNRNNFNLTSLQLKEIEDLNECTFKPKTNESRNLSKSFSLDSGERLFNYHKTLQEKKILNGIKYLNKQSEEYTFKPKLIRSNSLNNLKFQNEIASKLKFYKDKQVKNMTKLIESKERRFETEYNFKPKLKLTRYNSESKLPRYIKLNNDFDIKNQKIKALNIKFLTEFENLNPINKSKNRNNSLNLNKDYYNKLYNDANISKTNRIKLIKEYDLDFKPSINENVKVNSTFEERSNKLIELKKQIIKNMEIENIKNNNFNKLSKQEILENNKRVVERLYLKEQDKMKEKKKKISSNKFEDKLKSEHKVKYHQTQNNNVEMDLNQKYISNNIVNNNNIRYSNSSKNNSLENNKIINQVSSFNNQSETNEINKQLKHDKEIKDITSYKSKTLNEMLRSKSNLN